MGKVKSNAVDRRLKEIGAVLIRRNKHEIWRLPDGRNYVKAQTPSDWRAEIKQMKQLDRVLKEGERGEQAVL